MLVEGKKGNMSLVPKAREVFLSKIHHAFMDKER